MTDNLKILIVDDDESIRWVLDKSLKKKGCRTYLAKNGLEAIKRIKTQDDYSIVFLDIFMPDMNGLDVLQKIKQIRPDLFVVIMTAQGTMKNTIEAMQKGAYDYITKPFDLEEIYLLIEKISKEIEQRNRVSNLESELKERFEAGEIVGKGRKMREIFKIIGKAASTDVNILIQGESGTGKELVARALHYNSHRVTEPFITINCAAIPRDLLESELFGHEKGSFTGADQQKKGKFELAGKGTLFLDEIGDMDLSLQAKILRVLQDRKFYRIGGKSSITSEARIISATNQELEAATENKRFREDLYHRLNVIPILIPPLREHKEDIPLLAKHFVKKAEQELGLGKIFISTGILKLLQHHEWKGNIRELENTIKRAVIMSPGDSIQAEHLPSHFSKKQLASESAKTSPVVQFEKELYNIFQDISNWKEGHVYDDVIKSVEKVLFQNILKKTGWNQLQAANILGINRNTLRRKMEEHKLKKNAPEENH